MASPLPLAAHPVVGEVVVPGSKSETNRALVLAALADGPATLTGALRSRDSQLMVDALRSLGTGVDDSGDAWRVTPPSRFTGGASVDCGLAGTVMRFVPPVALLADGPTHFHGDAHASRRPVAGLVSGLRQLGARVDADQLPFTVTPGAEPAGGEVVVDSSATSQYISGLLLVGARLPGGLRLRHEGGAVPSRPHIEMTVAMLRDRGVVVDEPDDGTWVVHEGAVAALDTRVEPDLTNAAPFLAAAAATGGNVSVPGWPRTSLQPGALFLDVVASMGAGVSLAHGAATVSGDGRLRGVDVDLQAASELTPVVAALGALASGTTRISGVGHIRGHETDRLAALAAELNALGVTARETDDGLEIQGADGDAAPTREFRTYADHRMVHAAAILALHVPGVEVDDMACVGKTLPEFEQLWTGLVAR